MTLPLRWSNPAYASADQTMIDVMAVFAEGAEPVPYTVHKLEPETADLHAEIERKRKVKPYVAPPDPPLPVGAFLRRLHDAGKLEAFLAPMPTHEQALFYTRPAPIAADDPDIVARLAAIDVDPETIFASAPT